RRYSGSFNGEAVSGTAHFASEGGLCVGRIEATGALKMMLDGGSQAAAGDLRVVGIDPAGGLSRAGLVSPYGLYDLRAQAGGGFRAPFGGTRALEIAFAD